MVKLLFVLIMSGALAEAMAPAPPPLLIESSAAAPTAPLDAAK